MEVENFEEPKTKEYKAISKMVNILDSIVYELGYIDENISKDFSYIKRDIYELWSEYKNE